MHKTLATLLRKLNGGAEIPYFTLVPPCINSGAHEAVCYPIGMPDRTRAVLDRLEAENETFAIKREDLRGEDREIWLPEGEMRLWSIPKMTGLFLHWLVRSYNPSTVLELGTSAGYSTIWLADAMAKGSPCAQPRIHTVDMSRTKAEMARRNFWEAGISELISQISGDAADVLESWNKELDFVFLDADKKNYGRYLELILPHLKDGGIIVLDDAIEYLEHLESFTCLLRGNNRWGRLNGYLVAFEKGPYTIRKNAQIDVEQIMSFFG